MRKFIFSNWMVIAVFAFGANACSSNLKVKSSTVQPQAAQAKDSPTDTVQSEEKTVPTEEQTNTSLPQGEPITGLALVIKTDDGQLFRKDSIINTKNPHVEMETDQQITKITLLIATDGQCSDPLFEFDLGATTKRSLDFLNDGTYFLCAYSYVNNSKIPASNNGMKLVLDRTPPAILGAKIFYLNQSKAVTLNVQDASNVTYEWLQPISLPTSSISDASAANPVLTASSDGIYDFKITLKDAAGNSTVDTITIVWDTTPPAIQAFTLDHEAADGFINSGEISSSASVTNLTSTGSDFISYSSYLPASTVCNSTQIYDAINIPTILSIPMTDASYAICVKLSDRAGNITYAKSPTITRDTQAPVLNSIVLANEAADGTIILAEQNSNLPAASLLASGFTTANYTTFLTSTATTCDGTRTYSEAAIPTISSLPNSDGNYVFCTRLADAAGNLTYGMSPALTRDIAPPDFTSLIGINEASDGWISSSELGAVNPILLLTASGYLNAYYSSPLVAGGLICDNSQTYTGSTLPTAANIPATDGSYAVCVKLVDQYGNITYGKSQTITRDTLAPVFTSLNLSGNAADGFINSSDASSPAAFADLVASGYSTVTYSAFLSNSPSITCDTSQTYSANAPAALNSGTVDGSLVVCAKLQDQAGNVTFGKSAQVIRDTVSPIFSSLTGINGASDGIVNQTEYLSPLPMLNLTASGHSIAEYSAISPSNIVCDGSATYSSSTVPSISDIPGADGTYAVCVRLKDAAGNTTYGKSQVVDRDIAPPILTSVTLINDASDGYINDLEKSGVTPVITIVASGQTSTFFTLPLDDSGNITCDGSKSYSQTSVPNALTIATDGIYAICIKISDTSGNTVFGKSPVIARDTVAPAVTSFLGANGAIDGYISQSESVSGSPIVNLIATDYQTIQFSNIVVNTTICNGSISYLNSSAPAINNLTVDGSYAVCAKLLDTAGNITFAKSQVIVRDTNIPVVNSFVLANQAADGYINATESGSSLAIAALDVSGSFNNSFTSILSDTTPVVCDGSQTYGNSSIPSINAATVDGPLAVCAKAIDSAGNVAYAKTPALIRDTSLPVFNNLLGANEAADGFINDTEKSSGLAAFTLNATGYTAAAYTPFQPSSVSCNSSLTYNLTSIPVISAMTADSNYAICVYLTDAAGNFIYGKSQIISRNAIGPVITSFPTAFEAGDGYLNGAEINSLNPFATITSTGATNTVFTAILDDSTPVTCDASKTYSNPSIPSINSIPTDGTWALCAKLSDNSGNITYGKTIAVIRDSIAPSFTSLVAINQAADGYINDSEKSSSQPLFQLTASGQSQTRFSIFLPSTATCDGTQTYGSTTIPFASDLTSDGSFVLCVKLSDAANNSVYGQSQIVVRDTTPPAISSFVLANEATDGYINNTEQSSVNPFVALSGSGYVTLKFTPPLNVTTNPTCDSSKTYNLSSAPLINTLGAAATYAVCAQLVDAAGNTTYGRSPNVEVSLSIPVFTSLLGANAASDGWVNASEYLSPLPMFTLTGSGYTTASFTNPLSGSVTCDNSQTYGNSSVPPVSALPGSDGSYTVCVKLQDAALNTAYGQSQSIQRDITPPSITSFVGANEGADGYINASETASVNPIASYSVTGYTSLAFSSILDDTSPVTCDSSKTYSNGSVPLINTMPAGEAPYAVCGRFTDAAGNVTYGKSSVITKDVTAPVVNAGTAVTKSSLFTTVASATGATTYSWTKNAGTGTITFGTATALNTTVSASTDGAYTLRLTATDAAGNSTLSDLSLTWDTIPPVFTSLNGTNGASDGYINIAESSSSSVMFILVASGYNTINYTVPLNDTVPVTCDGSQSYTTSALPVINSLPSDGKWAICAKLIDTAGNTIYGKSQSIIRDTVVPTFAGFTLINEAADGFINNSEAASALLPATLNASDWSTAYYTFFLDETSTTWTCDGALSYQASMYAISSMTTGNSPYVICAKLVDAAGNISYGKSPQITKDTVVPTFTSLAKINGASDGYINQSEILSPLPIYSLTASGQNSTDYSVVLDSAVTCDGSQTYGNSTIPLISDIPGIDGSYVICVRLRDTAQNTIYGKSQVVTRDTVAPAVTSFVLSNGASDGFINSTEAASATVIATLTSTGGSTTTYSAALSDNPVITCDGSKSYPNGSVPNINSIGTDGTYAICASIADVAGNITYAKSPQVIRDAVAPTFTSLVGANGASDGYVNSTEYLSPLSLLTLTGSNYTGAAYTAVLASTATCNGTQTYGSSSIPLISDIPGSDAAYAVCVKLTDDAGNIAYGKSSTITRDVTVPVFTSLALTGAGSDGYINDAEKNLATVFVTLSGSGYTTQLYSAPLSNSPSVTCDASQTYSTATAPTVVNIPAAEGTYAVCVKLGDAALNYTYGKSAIVTKDITPPASATLSGTPAAYSRDTSLNVSVTGTETAVYKYGILNSYSTSCSGVTYSGYISTATAITDVLGSDSQKTLCVMGKDAAGNDQALPTVFNWQKDTTAPSATAFATSTTDNSGITVSWSAVTPDYGTYSYLVVRGVNSATWTPTAGATYSASNVGIGQDIVYVGSNLSFYDNTVVAGTYYEYSVFTLDLAGLYSTTGKSLKTAFIAQATAAGMEVPHTTIHGNEESLLSTSMRISGNGLTLVVGAPGNSTDGNNANPVYKAGAAYVYTRPDTASTWTFSQKLVAFGTNGRMASDNFGKSVSISGTTIAVGAPYHGYDETGANLMTNSGAVYTFIYSGGTWIPEQKLVPMGINSRVSSSIFGTSIDISNDILAVGATSHGYDAAGGNLLSTSGAVFMFARSGGVWSLSQKVVATGTNARNANDQFGYAVALTGTDLLAVGALYHGYDANGANLTGSAGAAFVYRLSAGTWSLQQKIIPTGASAWVNSGYFGYSVAVDGTTLIVGSPNNNVGSYGCAFVFVESAGVWTQQQKLISNVVSGSTGDYFGMSVSISGDSIAVGERKGYDSSGGNYINSSGAAMTFFRSAGVWSLSKRVSATGTNARQTYDYFGSAVAISGGTLVVGSPNQDWDSSGTINSYDSGAFFTFLYSAPNWPQSQRMTQSENQSRSHASSAYGSAVVVSADGLSLFVGAPQDNNDNNELNLPGYSYFNSAQWTGAVYYYSRVDANSPWVKQQKIVPTTRETGARFGSSLAFDADTLVVGSPYASTDASGANSVSSAGAVLVFIKSGGVYVQQQKIVSTGTNGRMNSDYMGWSVGISGDTIAAGAMYQDYDAGGSTLLGNSGAVYIYNRSAGVWTFSDKLVASGTNARVASGYFGYSLDLLGDILAVGAYGNSTTETGSGVAQSDAGAVYVFRRVTGVWAAPQKICNPSFSSSRFFGASVSLSGTSLAIGSYAEPTDESGLNALTGAGAAFIFSDSAGTYTLQKKLVGFGINGRNSQDNFGIAVKLRGDILGVGAIGQDFDMVGQNSMSNAGAIYSFYRTGTTWFYGKRYTPTTTALRGVTDYYGTALDFTSNNFYVGSPFADVDATNGTMFSWDKGSVFMYSP